MGLLGKMAAQMAKDGAKTGLVPADQARMCSGCAFKEGTPANGEQPALERALTCLLGSGQTRFHCHQERERICGGFMLARALDRI